MQLVLIGGAQRSGTTLLQTLLANALDSPILPEAHILSDIFATYKRCQGIRQQDVLLLSDRRRPAVLLSVLCATPHCGHRGRRKTRWRSGLEGSQLRSGAGRGGRSCFLSPYGLFACGIPATSQRPLCRSGRGRRATKPGKYEKRDISFISKKILASYQPLMQASQPPKAVVVRYEDLASDPKEPRALARDTGLKLSLDRIERPVWLDAQARHEASWITELEGGKASPASIGSFKRVLRGDEVAVVQSICEPIMSRFGYTPIEDRDGASGSGS